MTPGALVGLIGVAVSSLTPSARETDKVSCVLAHEAAQDLRQRNLLQQSREQLLFCSDSRCPRLVAEECRTLLAEIDRLRATDKISDPTAAPSETRAAAPDETATDNEIASVTSVAPAVPARAAPQPKTLGECCALVQQLTRVPDVPPKSPETALSPRSPSARDTPVRRTRPAERWRAPVFFGTLTVVALAGAAYFGWRGLSEADQLGRTCSPDCDPSQVSPIRRQLLIADVSLLAGVGLGTLTAWTIWKGRAEESGGAPGVSSKPRGEPAPGTGWSLVPRLGSLQVEYGGHF